MSDDSGMYSPLHRLGGGEYAPQSRLWSLWDMLTLYARKFAMLGGNIQAFGHPQVNVPPEQELSPRDRAKVVAALKDSQELCRAMKMDHSMALIAEAAATLNHPAATHGLMQTEFTHLFRTLKHELHPRWLLWLSPEEAAYYESGLAPFGEPVATHFPSAREDIEEASKCLGLCRNTAAVFHLMRVAEIGLRVLAWDRRVVLTGAGGKVLDIPLELAPWDKILRELEKAESAIENFKKTRAREAQFAFYHGAMIELRAFKNKFRNRIMHTRESYDRHQAASAMDHVRNFMQTLAERISEKNRTPVVWTEAQIKPPKAPSVPDA